MKFLKAHMIGLVSAYLVHLDYHLYVDWIANSSGTEIVFTNLLFEQIKTI